VALRRNFSGPVCSTDPVKVSKDVASLLVCTRKKFLLGGCGFFVSDITSISLKFLLETRLQSQSFDTLDDLLGFRVQKL